MVIPKTIEAFLAEFYKSVELKATLGNQRINQFYERVLKVEDEILVEAVIQIIEERKRPNYWIDDQRIASAILIKINPKSTKQFEEIFLRIVNKIDKSVYDFPKWLKVNYEMDHIQKWIAKLEPQLDKKELDYLNTFKFWLRNI